MFTRRLLVSCISAALLTSVSVHAVDTKAAAKATAQLSQQQNQPQAQVDRLSQAQLDQMLAPIALYPDTVLTHVLIASTYPLELVKAARWLTTQGSMTSEQLLAAAENQDWDPSVRALVAFPNIITTLNNDLDWTQNLGDAFLAQPDDVMDTIQRLREKAYAAGSLNNQEYYTVERKERVIVIEPRSPEVVYVPVYDARYVYGDWWWHDYPPVYWRSYGGYSSGSYFYWGAGVRVAPGFYFSTVYWPRREVIVVPHYRRTHYYRSHDMYRHEERRHWRHEPVHRRGVEYRRGYDPVADVRERDSSDYRGRPRHDRDNQDRNNNHQGGYNPRGDSSNDGHHDQVSPKEKLADQIRRNRGEQREGSEHAKPVRQETREVIDRQDNTATEQVGEQIQDRRQSAIERMRQRVDTERQGGRDAISPRPELTPQDPVRDRIGSPVDGRERFKNPRSIERVDGEPVRNEPVFREPVRNEPVFQEPVRNEPVFREPVRNEPVFQEPVRNEPVFREPVRNEPVFQEPVRNEPVFREPVRNDPVFQEPVRNEPVFREPVRNEPVFQEPVRNEPVFREPVRNEPVFREPVRNEPMRIEQPRMESSGGDRMRGLRRDD